jgi:hypothetical protein
MKRRRAQGQPSRYEHRYRNNRRNTDDGVPLGGGVIMGKIAPPMGAAQ